MLVVNGHWTDIDDFYAVVTAICLKTQFFFLLIKKMVFKRFYLNVGIEYLNDLL